jgi:hypothetical protein
MHGIWTLDIRNYKHLQIKWDYKNNYNVFGTLIGMQVIRATNNYYVLTALCCISVCFLIRLTVGLFLCALAYDCVPSKPLAQMKKFWTQQSVYREVWHKGKQSLLLHMLGGGKRSLATGYQVVAMK